ncbi:hypothetical protein QCA50_008164 [Cerrena zonata]|uniref:Glycoside hydrolase family 76 protein n=1 Tax=Cerrena zonata TaxID=2478898 RepID=A0AAW0G5H7_9APHY
MILLTLLPVLLISRSLAQDYSIPSQWVNTTSSLSRSDRIRLSSDVLATFTPLYNSTDGIIPTLFFNENAELSIATAIYDSLVDGESNYNAYKQRFSLVTSFLPPQSPPSAVEDLWWGIAAVEAFKAYNDTYFLDNAISIWKTYRPLVVTQSDADNGYYAERNVSFPSTCNGGEVTPDYMNDAHEDLRFQRGRRNRCILMRGLYRHWTHSPKDSEISKLIKAFLLVQYNNLQNNAQYNAIWYSTDWRGPPVPSLVPRGQLDAFDVLNFAIGVEGEPDLPTTSSSMSTNVEPTNTPSPKSITTKHTLSLGPIVGGTIGGFVLVAIAILVFVIRYRRRARNHRNNYLPRDNVERETVVINENGFVRPNQHPFVEPFPPLFPALDLPNSSKLRNEFQHTSATPAAVVHDPPQPPSSRPPTSPPATEEPQAEHRARSILSHSIPSSAPPEYQTVVS